MRDVDPRRTSGILLLIGFALHLGGVLIFNGRFFLGWFTNTGGWFTWERSLFIAAYATAALGAGLLGSIVRQAGRTVGGRLAATSFLIAAVLAIVVEASFLRGDSGRPLLGVMVVALFLAEALLGWSLIGSGATSKWIGRAVAVWSVVWLVVLVGIAAEDIYYPILHFLPLLFVGIGLLRRHESAPPR